MNKRGLEMSIGMVVMLILSVLIFILAISFLWNWYGKAETLKAEIDMQTEQQIMNALRQGNSLVSIPINVQSVQRGDPATFGVGVRNVGSPSTFTGVLSFSGAYFPDGSRNTDVDASYIEDGWLGSFRYIEPFQLDRNRMDVFPVLIQSRNRVSEQRSTAKGDYVFNLCIYDGGDYSSCSPDMLGEVYSNRIYQLTVRVI